MGVLRYAANELLFRSGRSLVTAVSIALAVLAAIVLTSLAAPTRARCACRSRRSAPM